MQRGEAMAGVTAADGRRLVVAAEPGFEEDAASLAAHLNAPLASRPAAANDLVMFAGSRGLALVADGMELRQDFSRLIPRIRPDRLGRELVVRAVRIKGGPVPLQVVDATAGLGEDSFLLAAAGAEVLLCENNPVICVLLADALARAAHDPALAPIAARMRVREGDGIATLAGLPSAPDVVYLDPMFPERRKSAAVKKKFQLLHLLETPCANPGELLTAAVAAGPRKVVVKRPLHGPDLAGRAPSHRIMGKAVRFDCLVPAGEKR